MSGTRLKMVVSTPTFLPNIGGAELGIHEVFSRLAHRHEVVIVTPRYSRKISDAQGTNDYQDAKYEVYHPLSRFEMVCPGLVMRILHRTSISYIVGLFKLYRRGSIDVANFHYIKAHGMALLLLRRLLGVPVVLSLVGRSDVLQSLSRPARAFAELVIANADAVLPISAFYLSGAHSDKMQVVPYGVDTKRFAPERRSAAMRGEWGVDDDQLILLAVQRLAPVKKVDALIRILARVAERDDNAILVIVGRGEEESALRRLGSELGIADRIRFAGYVSDQDLPAYFASADLFVFHSLFETFGIVFAQAMASALPIIAARTSCVPDVVHADNGVLIEPFDTDSFRDAIISLGQDPARRTMIGKRNRRRAEEEFDWDIIADRYEQIFASAISD